jgi:hypothetical protein
MSSTSTPAKKTVVFCVPGRTFSNNFLQSWTETLSDLLKSGNFNVLLSNEYSSCVHLARARCLGLSVDRGPVQKPWNGEVPYDVLVWIDSDMVFRSRDVLDLIQATEQYPVVSGLYMMDDRQHFCAVEKFDNDYFVRNCHFEALTAARISEWTRQTGNPYLPCVFVGLGFCAFRHGILEDPRLKYPYFYSPVQSIKTGRADVPEYRDLVSEDASLFHNLIEAGLISSIMVKTDLRVGHEKSTIL